MNRFHVTGLVASFLLIVTFATPLLAQKEGDFVVVAKANTRLDRAGELGAVVPRGTVLQVSGSRGSWFRVQHSLGEWVAKANVIPLDSADIYFEKMAKESPNDVEAFHAWGQATAEKQGWIEAVKIYDQCIQSNPKSAMAHFYRGLAKYRAGQSEGAIADYELAIQTDEKLGIAYNNLAWIRATSVIPALRSVDSAKTHAQKAVELMGSDNAIALDTLAAAHAEAGEFLDAISAERKAIQSTPAGSRGELQARLKSYLARKPFRDGAN